jgi:hypothetical protein
MLMRMISPGVCITLMENMTKPYRKEAYGNMQQRSDKLSILKQVVFLRGNFHKLGLNDEGNDIKRLKNILSSEDEKALLFLDLSDNSIGNKNDSGASMLARFIEDNKTLKKIDLSGNPISESGVNVYDS